MNIIIDADACPKGVLQICLRLGACHQLPVWTVASFNHQICSERHIVVGGEPQATDLKIMNLAQGQDVVITQDWGLVAMLLGRGVYCLGPTGLEYTATTIDFLLEEREMKAKLRRRGGRTKGPGKRRLVEDEKFAAALERILLRRERGE